MDSLRALYANRPNWIEGYISWGDTVFLVEMLQSSYRIPIVEVGVASGCSSALLLQILSVSSCEDIWLHSYDIAEECYFDPTRRTGQAVEEMVPALQKHWQFHIGGASDVGSVFSPESIEFAFIDANHRHPWPTLDFIAILPYLMPNAWVAIHDINLPVFATNPKWKVYGPKHLFDAWPWKKRIATGGQKNIGAVKVPSDHGAVLKFLKTLMELKWEARVSEEYLTKIGFDAFICYKSKVGDK